MIGGTLYALGQMVDGHRSTDELGGPLRIAQMSGEIAQRRLGAGDLVHGRAVDQSRPDQPVPDPDAGRRPSPALRDRGGRGRPLTERSQEIAFRFGLAMVLSLMVFATWNDLVHLKIIEFFAGLIS